MTTGATLNQIFIMGIYMLGGWIMAKRGIIRYEQSQFLSRFILALPMPLTIIASANMDVDAGDVVHLLVFMLCIMLMMALSKICMLTASAVLKWTPEKRAVYTSLAVYPNVGFIGIPLCTALLGNWGTLYGAMSVIGGNFMYFIWQNALFEPGKKIDLRGLITVLNLSTVIALGMLILRIHLPDTVQTAFTNLGGCATPLALVMTGSILGQGKFSDLFRSKVSYIMVFLRNFFWPVACIGLALLLPITPRAKFALMVFAVTPCASMSGMYATKYNMLPELANRTVILSTLCSIVSMPLVLSLAQLVLPAM